jgi:hypothetical protein
MWLSRRAHGWRELPALSAPAREEVGDGDDYGEGRQHEHSVNRVHPVERLPCAESGYVLTTKTLRGRAFDSALSAQVRSMAADQFESSKVTKGALPECRPLCLRSRAGPMPRLGL